MASRHDHIEGVTLRSVRLRPNTACRPRVAARRPAPRGPHRPAASDDLPDLRDARAGRHRPGAAHPVAVAGLVDRGARRRRHRLGPDPLAGHLPPAQARRHRPPAADALQPADRGPLHRRPAHHRSRSSSTSPRATRTDHARPRPTPTTQITVTGIQWSWQFNYTSDGEPRRDGHRHARQAARRCTCRRARRCSSRLHSNDVIHSFWVPAFLFKMDVIPGQAQQVRDHPEQDRRRTRASAPSSAVRTTPGCCSTSRSSAPAEYDTYVSDLQSRLAEGSAQ